MVVAAKIKLMNILIPTHYFSDEPLSGLHTVIWNTVKSLSDKGHSIYVISTFVKLNKESVKGLADKRIFVYRVINFQTHNLDKADSLAIFLRAITLRLFHKFDWIYIIDTSVTPFSRFKLGAKLACRVLSPKTPEAEVIFNGPDWSYDRARKDFEENWQERIPPISYRLIRFLAEKLWFKVFPVNEIGKNADIFFCQGKNTEKFYSEVSKSKIICLPNGVEDYRFDAVPAPVSDNRNFKYLFVGRIARRKGVFYLLEAFKKVADKHENVELIIVGKGSDELVAELKKKASGLLTDKKVRLLGELGRNEVIGLMKSADVIVDPMLYAGFSTVAAEGLYCKKPVIAPLFGGTGDFIKDGQNGFLVDARNVNDLADKMEFYYSNPEIASGMAQEGYEYVKSNLTWDKVVGVIDKCFSDMLCRQVR